MSTKVVVEWRSVCGVVSDKLPDRLGPGAGGSRRLVRCWYDESDSHACAEGRLGGKQLRACRRLPTTVRAAAMIAKPDGERLRRRHVNARSPGCLVTLSYACHGNVTEVHCGVPALGRCGSDVSMLSVGNRGRRYRSRGDLQLLYHGGVEVCESGL